MSNDSYIEIKGAREHNLKNVEINRHNRAFRLGQIVFSF